MYENEQLLLSVYIYSIYIYNTYSFADLLMLFSHITSINKSNTFFHHCYRLKSTKRITPEKLIFTTLLFAVTQICRKNKFNLYSHRNTFPRFRRTGTQSHTVISFRRTETQSHSHALQTYRNTVTHSHALQTYRNTVTQS